MTLSVGRNH